MKRSQRSQHPGDKVPPLSLDRQAGFSIFNRKWLPRRGVTLPPHTDAPAARHANTELNGTFVWAQKLDLEFKESSFPHVFHGLVWRRANVTSRPPTKEPTATFVALIMRRGILLRPDATERFSFHSERRFYRSDVSPFPSDPENVAPSQKLS